ncbi:MAG: hypothetical protein AMXMBFR64_31750 [Myxococcales bacterium]
MTSMMRIARSLMIAGALGLAAPALAATDAGPKVPPTTTPVPKGTPTKGKAPKTPPKKQKGSDAAKDPKKPGDGKPGNDMQM